MTDVRDYECPESEDGEHCLCCEECDCDECADDYSSDVHCCACGASATDICAERKERAQQAVS